MSQKKKTKKSNNSNGKVPPVLIIAGILVIIAGVIYFGIISENEPKPVKKLMNNKNIFDFKKEGELSFVDANDEFIANIEIEIADNEEERNRGLMQRASMKENRGMLFIFPDEQVRSFWMMNTFISLDIIFLNEKREIVKIHHDTKPFKYEISYESGKPAKYVVEVNAGFTKKHNIKEGDKIIWRKL